MQRNDVEQEARAGAPLIKNHLPKYYQKDMDAYCKGALKLVKSTGINHDIVAPLQKS